jgi:hypothetical protein
VEQYLARLANDSPDFNLSCTSLAPCFVFTKI